MGLADRIKNALGAKAMELVGAQLSELDTLFKLIESNDPKIMGMLRDENKRKLLLGVNGEGDTALIVAARNGHIEFAVALVELGADVYAINDKNQNALTAAIAGKKFGLVEELLKSVEDPKELVNQRHGLKRCALSEAMTVDNFQTMKVLMSHGADPGNLLKEGFNPLVKALRMSGGTRVVKLLIESSLDLSYVMNGTNIVKEACNDSYSYYGDNASHLTPARWVLENAESIRAQWEANKLKEEYIDVLETRLVGLDPQMREQIDLLRRAHGLGSAQKAPMKFEDEDQLVPLVRIRSSQVKEVVEPVGVGLPVRQKM